MNDADEKRIAAKLAKPLAMLCVRNIAGTQWATRKHMNMTALFADQTQGAVVA